MSFFIRRELLALGLAVAALVGCATTPSQTYSEQADKSFESTMVWQGEQEDAVEAALLTDLVNLPELNSLIEQAMSSNPSLQQTMLALRIAYNRKTNTASDGLPSVSAGFDAYKEDGADVEYSADLTVGWELDVWRGISASTSAAEKDIASSLANLQQTKDTLAADIMRAWLQINYQIQIIDIQLVRLDILDANESIILEQYRSGLGDLDDLDAAITTAFTARSNLAGYRETLASNKRDLALLIGVIADDVEVEFVGEFPTVLSPLATLPEQDLSRRPDLQAAYYDIEAADFNAVAAYKDLLPSFSLQFALRNSSESLVDTLFTSPVWSLLGQLSAPLFEAGSLKATAQTAELSAESAYWAYQDTLLTAVNEVEEALSREQSFAQQQNFIEQALLSAQSSLENYVSRYREGLVDISDLLSSQSSTFDLEAQLAQIKYNRLTNRIDLGMALGLGVSQ